MSRSTGGTLADKRASANGSPSPPAGNWTLIIVISIATILLIAALLLMRL